MPMLLHHSSSHLKEAKTQRTYPDFGDVQDNETALYIALYELQHGQRTWGCEVLLRLREHILITREVKSLQWLLPQVELALRSLCADISPAQRSAAPS